MCITSCIKHALYNAHCQYTNIAGVPEDPVTGSAYTQLAPYWASKISSKKFRVKQMSSRGGELSCEGVGDRVFISGKAIKYLEGKIKIET